MLPSKDKSTKSRSLKTNLLYSYFIFHLAINKFRRLRQNENRRGVKKEIKQEV